MPIPIAASFVARYAVVKGLTGRGGSKPRGFQTSRGGGVDLRVEAADLMRRLDGLGKYPARRAFHAAGVYSTRLIDRETSKRYLAASYKSRPRAKGFRKRIKRKGAFKYETKQYKNGIMRFRSMLNFRYPEMHVGRWLERGHQIGNSPRRVPPWNLRRKAFDAKKGEAQKAFIKALRTAFDVAGQTKNGSVPMKAIESVLGDPWKK